MLGGLGFQVSHGIFRDEGDVDDDCVFRGQVASHLPYGFEKRHALDITDSASNLHQAYIGALLPRYLLLGRELDTGLDLIGDVGDDLDRFAKEITASLLLNHCPVYLPCRDVVGRGEIDIKETFVVAEVKVNLTSV